MQELSAPEQLFLSTLTHAAQQHGLMKCVLSKYQGSELALQRLTIRLVLLRDEAQLSFVYNYQTHDMTKNFSQEEQKIIGQ